MHAAQLIKTSSSISLQKPICETLKRLPNENPSNFIFSSLNTNSICYKFEDLKDAMRACFCYRHKLL